MKKFISQITQEIRENTPYLENKRLVADTVCDVLSKTEKNWTKTKTKNFFRKCGLVA